MSLPEVLLWQQLKLHPGGYLFRKQHPIGPYTLDFACVKARLAIEIDGESHNRGDRPERDAARDAWVLTQGFETIRFPAVEIMKNMEGVLIAFVEECRKRSVSNPSSSPTGANSLGDSSATFAPSLEPILRFFRSALAVLRQVACVSGTLKWNTSGFEGADYDRH